jgi:3-polyprenyl-4-hydroxybenzoate decarboxylase
MVADLQTHATPAQEWDDLRGFIDLAEADGELQCFNNVDWHLEIGAINEAMAQRRGPMCLFDESRAIRRASASPATR